MGWFTGAAIRWRIRYFVPLTLLPAVVTVTAYTYLNAVYPRYRECPWLVFNGGDGKARMRLRKRTGRQGTGSAIPRWTAVVEICVTQHRREVRTRRDFNSNYLHSPVTLSRYFKNIIRISNVRHS